MNPGQQHARRPGEDGSIYNVVKIFEAPARTTTWFTEEVLVEGKRVT